MTETATAERFDAGTLAKAAVAAGVLAVIAFFGLGFAVGGWWFALAFVLGIAAVACGWVARNRPSISRKDRRLATIGLVVGAIPVVWFVVYMIVAAIF